MDDKSTQTKSDITLLDLPQVVVDQVISYLSPTTCLTLRRVCKVTRSWITSQSCNAKEIKKWKTKDFHLIITGKPPRTFASAVKMNLPIMSFHLANGISKQEIYESEGVLEFINLYQDRPVYVCVELLSMFQSVNEQWFYSRLKNIIELGVVKLWACVSEPLKNRSRNDDDFIRSLILPPPSSLSASLQTLVINNYEHSPWMPQHLADKLVLSWINSLKKLRTLNPPSKLKEIRQGSWVFRSRKRTYCPTWMASLNNEITANDWGATVKVNGRREHANLCIYLGSFMNTKYTERSYVRFVQNYVKFLQQSYKRNLTFRLVSGFILDFIHDYWIEYGWSANYIRESLKFLNNVVSLHNTKNVLLLGLHEMNKLEEIRICHVFARHQWIYRDPQELSWSSLKTLEVCLYITDESSLTFAASEAWDLTFRRVFENAKRSSVTSLKLDVSSKKGVRLERTFLDVNMLFQTNIITANFPCLKSLTIHGWDAYSYNFRNLIIHLKQLTYLSLSACKYVDDDPFNYLSNLKTLVLHLDKMPCITENLFTYILCNQPLKELQLFGKKPLAQLTTRAIMALQEGEFGKTIEKFPFNTWKSKWIKEKDKIQLKKGFHCIV